MPSGGEAPLVEVDRLRKDFRSATAFSLVRKAVVHAVDDISFSVQPHETLGLVGESGCGKTTTGRLILRLDVPTAGEIRFRGRNIHALAGQDLRRFRRSVQAVFQDPWSSFNPRLRVRSIVAEPLIVNERLSRGATDERVEKLLTAVGLEPGLANQFPHQFSGGMRQRLAVARALALNPDLVILDEPVSALDVSVRAQIMNLLKDLQHQFGLTYLLIAHDLATIRYLCHRIAVMYLGQIVEMGAAEEIFTNPCHPYTKALLSAALKARPGGTQGPILLRGDPPSPTTPPPGCRFHTRCPIALESQERGDAYWDRARTDVPQLREVRPRHLVRCHHC